MREKTCREVIVNKYIEFLKDVQCYDIFEHTELSELIAKHGINKTVRKAIIDLSIIDYKNDAYWNYLSFEPSKPLALSILNYLLERSKKSRATVIPGMEETNAILKALSQQFSDYVGKREHSYKTHPIGLKSETLFSEIDSKQDLINKAAFAIASGVYSNSKYMCNHEYIPITITHDFGMYHDSQKAICSKCGHQPSSNDLNISEQNERIVFVAKDLVNQLLK